MCKGNRIKFLREKNLIDNLIFGWNYIANSYTNSVFKIENKDSHGNFSIGTGFYLCVNFRGKRYFIVTNNHVFDSAKSIRVLTKGEEEIKYKAIIKDEQKDIAFIELEEEIESLSFHLNVNDEVLSEIITIGYPKIPMTKMPYQVVHKGEINSWVEDYYGNQLFLFSAKTSSGNSGSPIIDDTGMVIGMVTEELFEKGEFQNKGKLPYYAGIPSVVIIWSLYRKVFCNEKDNVDTEDIILYLKTFLDSTKTNE